MKFLFDLLPVILFFAVYQLFDIYVATGAAIAVSAAQIAFLRLRHGKVEKMHWVVLILLIALGIPTILLQDPTFIKWKPTLVNWLFAAAFVVAALLSKRNLLHRMLGEQLELPTQVWSRLNIAWILFFLASGGLNLWVAYAFSEEFWVNFKLFGMLGMTFVFVLGQGFYMARYLPAAEDTIEAQGSPVPEPTPKPISED